MNALQKLAQNFQSGIGNFYFNCAIANRKKIIGFDPTDFDVVIGPRLIKNTY